MSNDNDEKYNTIFIYLHINEKIFINIYILLRTVQ
jgi:hypothetical protein